MQVTIQPTDKFTIEFNGAEIGAIYNGLLSQPYGQVAPLIQKIEQLLQEQKSPIKDE